MPQKAKPVGRPKQGERATAKHLRSSFLVFSRALWKRMGYDQVAPIGQPEAQMMKYLEIGPRRRGILSYRGVGKTHIAVGYIAWRLRRDPNLKIILVSKTQQHAVASVQMLLGWFNNIPWLQDMAPNRKAGHRMSLRMGEVDIGTCQPHARTATLTALGMEQQLEGKRAHLLVADDVETDENTYSLETRHKLDQRVREFPRVCSYGGREIVYLGTYHHEDSVYLKLHERGYHFRTWPVCIPSPEEMVNALGENRMIGLAPELKKAVAVGDMKPGDKVFPHRTNDDFINDARNEGLTSWYMHYMLLTDIGETTRYPLRMSDCMVIDTIDPERAPRRLIWGMTEKGRQSTALEGIASMGFGDDCWHAPAHVFHEEGDFVSYQDTKMWIDPAGRGVDKVGFAVIGLLNGFLFVKECGSLIGGYEDENIHRLCKIARNAQTREIVVEDNFGQGMMEQMMLRILRQDYFNVQEQQPYLGPISGAGAAEAAATHAAAHKPWACHVRSQRVTQQKELRILENLEPVTHGHKLILPKKVAESEEFQRQYTRLQRKKGCLGRDDEIESLGMCVSLFRDRLDVTVEQTEQHRIDRHLQEAYAEQERETDFLFPQSSRDQSVWLSHRRG